MRDSESIALHVASSWGCWNCGCQILVLCQSVLTENRKKSVQFNTTTCLNYGFIYAFITKLQVVFGIFWHYGIHVEWSRNDNLFCLNFASALMKGCRCLEIDCWDGSQNEPVVYHGYTLTSKLLFKTVIQAVHKYAFIVRACLC